MTDVKAVYFNVYHCGDGSEVDRTAFYDTPEACLAEANRYDYLVFKVDGGLAYEWSWANRAWEGPLQKEDGGDPCGQI